MTAPTSTDWLDLAERLLDAIEHASGSTVSRIVRARRACLEMAGECLRDERHNPTTPHREGSQ